MDGDAGQLREDDAHVYHLANVAAHIAVCTMLWVLCRRLLLVTGRGPHVGGCPGADWVEQGDTGVWQVRCVQHTRGRWQSCEGTCALGVALLYAVHPVHTESVSIRVVVAAEAGWC